MARRTNQTRNNLKNDLKRIGSIIASLGVIFTAGYFIGEWRTESRMQVKIHELEFQTLQLKVEYTEKLYIEQLNKESGKSEISDEDLAEFVKTLNAYVQQKSHEKK
jgi:hypothetical protein